MLNIHLFIALLWLVAGALAVFGPGPITGLTAVISIVCVVMATFNFLMARRPAASAGKRGVR